MTDTPDNTPKQTDADRIAKVIARAGVASRREAERMIIEGRVTVNGQKIDSPALDVLPSDRITVDGRKLDEKQETRLWLYYKPIGLITSESDEKGRQTVFDALPRDLPRVMTVGRLDLNSEGLLLLTNDGDLKRRLELPSTGWLRRYRVRVNGNPNDLTFAPLRRGVIIEGEEFAPMEIKLDSQQGANAWLTVGIREGKNREIRRAMAHVGLQVNRLIRIGYGPFKLTGLEKNEVTEVKRRVLRDQLGGLLTGEVEEKEREMRPHGAEGGRRPFRDAGADNEGRRPFRRRLDEDGERPARPRWQKDGEGRAQRNDRDDAPRGPRSATGDRPQRASGGKPWEKGDRPARGPRREDGDTARPRWKKDDGAAPRGPRRDDGDAPRGPRSATGDRPQRASGGKPWEKGDRPARGPRREDGDTARPRWKKDDGAAPRGPRRDDGDAPRGPRSATGDRPQRASGGKPWEKGDRPARGPRKDDASTGDRPRRSPAGAKFGPKSADGGGQASGQGSRSRAGKPDGGFGKAGSQGARGKTDRPGGFAGNRSGGGKPAGRLGGKPGGRPAGKPRGPEV